MGCQDLSLAQTISGQRNGFAASNLRSLNDAPHMQTLEQMGLIGKLTVQTQYDPRNALAVQAP